MHIIVQFLGLGMNVQQLATAYAVDTSASLQLGEREQAYTKFAILVIWSDPICMLMTLAIENIPCRKYLKQKCETSYISKPICERACIGPFILSVHLSNVAVSSP